MERRLSSEDGHGLRKPLLKKQIDLLSDLLKGLDRAFGMVITAATLKVAGPV
jgi:hypothetical protein